MAEMIVTTPEVRKTLHDYDIVFESGIMMPVTIDLSLGDAITFNDKVILVNLSPKPSQSDPLKLLPAEDIRIFTPHVISIQHREREVVELSPEAKFQWGKDLKELVTGTVQ